MSEPHPGGQPAKPDGAPQFSKEPPAEGGAAPAQPPGGTPQQPPASEQQPPAYGQQPPGQPGGYGRPANAGPLDPAQQRQWAMWAHLSGLATGILGSLFGLVLVLGFVGPLVIYLMYRDRAPFVREQALEALNFQILISVIGVVAFVVTLVTLGIGALLTVPLLGVVGIAALVLIIMAAVAANRGENYRYPLNWRVVK